jgi:outer membrane protein assembly factor BamA
MNRPFLLNVAMIAIVCSVGVRPVMAQDQSTSNVDEPGLFRRTFTWVGSKMTGGSGEAKDGLYPELGGMIPGAGWLSVGPGYRHHLFGDAAVVNASAAMSSRRYAMMQSRIEWPALFSDHLSLGAGGKYQDFTEINYFGVGPDSDKSAWTDYRLKSIDIAGHATVRPADWLSIGGSVGYTRGLDIAPGLSSIHPATQDLFDAMSTPGLNVQPRYRHADVFVEADTRDVPGYTKSGGAYRLGVTTFHDLDQSGQSFRRVDAGATQYVPLIRRNWIMAVRGQIALSQTGAGNEVPFYMMPTLGGKTTLRGFQDYRFRDRNAASVGAEYRLPVSRMVDAAVFVDAGSVAATARGLRQGRLEHDYGIGLRLHTATKSIARIDVAKGREGTRVLLSLTKSLGGSRNSVAPYTP